NISTLLIDPSNPSIIYAGTGESFAGPLGRRGAGIFKSIDGGATWAQLASTSGSPFYYVNDLVMSPAASQRLYAATDAGVWRTSDGGASWTKILDQAYCVDLAIRTDVSADYLFAACNTGSIVLRNENAAGSGTWASVLT